MCSSYQFSGTVQFLIVTFFFSFLKGISPDVVTYSTLMKAFIRARKFDKVLNFF